MVSKFDKIYKAIDSGKTLLGVGPMSWNCVDATIEIANECDIPLKLICSRRQVECKTLGGGYVTDTEKLAEYVKLKDVKNNIFLSRDHGSVWQGANEFDLSHKRAMNRSLQSYAVDIESKFDILHIDPSLKSRPIKEILRDIHITYAFCVSHFEDSQILYEVGTEEHSGQITTSEDFENFAKEMQHCDKVKFVVGNMGLWVKEVENVGKFDEEQAKKLIKICNDNGLYLKGHNTDYVRPEVLKRQRELGVHSINVAPEFGVRETEELLYLFEFHRMEKQRNQFIKITVESGKWKKWMKDPNEDVPDLYKAKICGHYVFSDPRVEELKDKLRKKCDLDNLLKNTVKNAIKQYLFHLGWEKELDRV